MRNTKKTDYTHSPWSGKAYEQAPSVDELTKESQAVLQSHPTISKAIRLESMDKFIAEYKAKNGIK